MARASDASAQREDFGERNTSETCVRLSEESEERRKMKSEDSDKRWSAMDQEEKIQTVIEGIKDRMIGLLADV